MKRTVCVLFVLIAIILIGCENDTKPINEDEYKGGVYLTGIYGRKIVSASTYSDRLIFTDTTFSTIDGNISFLSGDYKYDGSILTLVSNGTKYKKYAFFIDNVITISGDGPYSDFFNGTWTER